MNDDLRNKIEEILNEYFYDRPDNVFVSSKELSTLYTEMVEGELREYLKYVDKRTHWIDMDMENKNEYLLKMVKQYLLERKG